MSLTAGEIVKLARHQDRLTSLDYFEKIFTDFQELHGDRHFGDDPAIVGVSLIWLENQSQLLVFKKEPT